MGRSPAPVVIHRLSLAEQRVLSCFLAGRLPAGQIHAELTQARAAAKTESLAVAQPTVQPSPAVAA